MRTKDVDMPMEIFFSFFCVSVCRVCGCSLSLLWAIFLAGSVDRLHLRRLKCWAQYPCSRSCLLQVRVWAVLSIACKTERMSCVCKTEFIMVLFCYY